MSLLRALKAKPDVYFLFGLLWLVAASAIELGYVGWYLDKWTEALATTSAMYLISLLYLARSYYRLMTETLARIKLESEHRTELLVEFFNDHLKTDVQEPGMFRCCKNENGFDVITSPGIAVLADREIAEAPKQEYMSIRKIRDAIEGIPDLILVSAESLLGEPKWDEAEIDYSRGAEYYLSARNPSNLVVLDYPTPEGIWEYAIYVNYQFAGKGRTRKGEHNALMQFVHGNPGLVVDRETPKLLRALQNIIDRR